MKTESQILTQIYIEHDRLREGRSDAQCALDRLYAKLDAVRSAERA